MKYSISDYAKALDRAISDATAKPDVIVKNFMALIRRNGDEGRGKKILDEAARMARRGRSGKALAREVVIQSARPLSKSQEAIVKHFLKPGDMSEYQIDPSLIAGIKMIVNDEMQFDGTMKAKLDKLFTA